MITETLLNVLVSEINGQLDNNGSNDFLSLTFEGAKISIERTTRTDKRGKEFVDRVYILIDANFTEANHYLVGFQTALSFIPVEAMLVAIVEAENFISGFEDDDDQEGVPELLTKLRVLHPQYR